MISKKHLKDNWKHCQNCGFDWEARTDDPVKCPECQNRNWNGKRVIQKQRKKVS